MNDLRIWLWYYLLDERLELEELLLLLELEELLLLLLLLLLLDELRLGEE